MKAYIRLALLILAFSALSFILLFVSLSSLNEKPVDQRQAQNLISNEQVLGIESQQENPGFPVRLKIPRINVDATIEYVGLTSHGEMEVPRDAANAGWFDLGPRPGENGSAVIAGHVDADDGKAGVFTDLHKLKGGDKLYVQDSEGRITPFIVRESRTYDPGYAVEVFSLNSSAYLNLITCDGVWDGAKKSYSKRLVVFADIAG